MAWNESYIPYKSTIKQSAKTIELQIVCDASAKSKNTSPSTNECQKVGSWPTIAKRFLGMYLQDVD